MTGQGDLSNVNIEKRICGQQFSFMLSFILTFRFSTLGWQLSHLFIFVLLMEYSIVDSPDNWIHSSLLYKNKKNSHH